ncbi:MAG: DUF1622 domain-containing protein [Rhodospirillales bacterium]|nr:DUF1622 domain-containing protein [Rhodospirillales bacterium]
MSDPGQATGIPSLVDEGVRLVGTGLEVFGVLVFVVGIAVSTWLYLREGFGEHTLEAYKIRIGRSLLLGLEVLVAGDVVKTVAHELTFTGLGQLAGLVVIRTFLSWTLVLEIEGRWPWQKRPAQEPKTPTATKG